MKKKILTAITLLSMALALYGCKNTETDAGAASKTEAAARDEAGSGTGAEGENSGAGSGEAGEYYLVEFENWFKAFEAETLSGDAVTEEILKQADVTMINIWGTFCSPCIDEMPDLGEINRAYAAEADADGTLPFQIIGLVGDALTVNEEGMPELSQNIMDKAKSIVDRTKADYLHILPSGNFGVNVMGTGSIMYFPSTIFVDSEGNILPVDGQDIVIGGHTKEQWEEVIEGVLLSTNAAS